MSNRIPRTATKLEVKFLTDTSVGKGGVTMIAEKTDNGWIGKYGEQSWHLFVQHLRNENFCAIKVIEQ